MGIYGDVSLSEEIGPDIIDSGGVICVFVGEQNAIELMDLIGEHLLPEIRAAVDDKIEIFP